MMMWKTCCRHTGLFFLQFACVLTCSLIGGLIIYGCEHANEQENNAKNMAARESTNATLDDLLTQAKTLVSADMQTRFEDVIANYSAAVLAHNTIPEDTNNW